MLGARASMAEARGALRSFARGVSNSRDFWLNRAIYWAFSLFISMLSQYLWVFKECVGVYALSQNAIANWHSAKFRAYNTLCVIGVS